MSDEDCASRARITGTAGHDGKVVRCDGTQHGRGYHGAPVPGAPEGRYVWEDYEALADADAVCPGEPCGHTSDEHLALTDEVVAAHPESMGRLLSAVFGVASPPQPTAPDMDRLLTSLGQMQDVHAAVLGAAVTHRGRCEAAGFSPSAAEALAFQFYQQALGK